MKRQKAANAWGIFFAIAGALFSAGAMANAIDHLQTTDDIGLNKVPHMGQSRILVIPSRIGDTFPEPQLQRLRELFGDDNSAESSRLFWQKQSNGRFDPITVLADPVLLSECPLPGRDENNCRFQPTDLELIQNGTFRSLFRSLLEKVRDEQNIDLAQFDINGINGEPDGYFDGVIITTDMFAGVGLPLAALSNTVEVGVTPQPLPPAVDAGPLVDASGTDAAALPDAQIVGPSLEMGIVALIPPDIHEFGHNLGFLDLYGGPTVTGLMGQDRAGLCAFSRLAIGWGEEEVISGAFENRVLAPVTSNGPVLRFGEGSRYLLIENRGGPNFDTAGEDHPGVYVYAVDESAFPSGPLGFIDLAEGELFLANASPPFLNVNMPLRCDAGDPAEPFNNNPCVMLEGSTRNLSYPNQEQTGFHLRIDRGQDADGNVTISVVEGVLGESAPDAGVVSTPDVVTDAGTSEPEEDDCACASTKSNNKGVPFAAFALLATLTFYLRPRR